MQHELEKPRALRMIGGYVAAVVVAAATAAVAITMGSPYGAGFLGVFIIGGAYIAITGLPGFAVTLFLARRHGWTDWTPFALAGGLNALLAWYLMSPAGGFGFLNGNNDLVLASIRGGIAGGVAYWWTAYHGFPRREVGQPATMG